jgi:hypothetical protein
MARKINKNESEWFLNYFVIIIKNKNRHSESSLLIKFKKILKYLKIRDKIIKLCKSCK